MKLLKGFLIVLFLTSIAFAGEYKLHGGAGLVQDMNTMGVFSPNALQIDANNYRVWLKKGNTPEPADPEPIIVIDEIEEKIKAEMRKLAIEKLIKEGALPLDYKDM